MRVLIAFSSCSVGVLLGLLLALALSPDVRKLRGENNALRAKLASTEQHYAESTATLAGTRSALDKTIDEQAKAAEKHERVATVAHRLLEFAQENTLEEVAGWNVLGIVETGTFAIDRGPIRIAWKTKGERATIPNFVVCIQDASGKPCSIWGAERLYSGEFTVELKPGLYSLRIAAPRSDGEVHVFQPMKPVTR